MPCGQVSLLSGPGPVLGPVTDYLQQRSSDLLPHLLRIRALEHLDGENRCVGVIQANRPRGGRAVSVTTALLQRVVCCRCSRGPRLSAPAPLRTVAMG